MDTSSDIKLAATCIAGADALLIGAGAGMGVDSGLPDFRGEQGFWRAYPACQRLGLRFADMANPRWFLRDPTFAWGFYGHRLGLYRATEPHPGFGLLLSWARRMRHGAFVFTSNVDGHFQRAGFGEDQVAEIHGSIHHLQCLSGCGAGIVPAGPYEVQVDEQTLRASPPLPACPGCGGLLRPNVLMFGDATWDDSRSLQQEAHLSSWLERIEGGRLVIVECGAGTAIPSVRHFCESTALAHRATLVRINKAEADVPNGHLGLSLPALSALQQLDAALRAL